MVGRSTSWLSDYLAGWLAGLEASLLRLVVVFEYIVNERWVKKKRREGNSRKTFAPPSTLASAAITKTLLSLASTNTPIQQLIIIIQLPLVTSVEAFLAWSQTVLPYIQLIYEECVKVNGRNRLS